MLYITSAMSVADIASILLIIIAAAGLVLLIIMLVKTFLIRIPSYDVLPCVDVDFDREDDRYAQSLSDMIKFKTISTREDTYQGEMLAFVAYIEERYPLISYRCDFTNYNGGMVIRWEGKEVGNPLVLMSHLDVVNADGEWKADPFGGLIEDGVVWGRGAVDTKGNLCAILEACESLIADNYLPLQDVIIFASSREEIRGSDAAMLAKYLKDSNIRPRLVVDEGGAMIDNPIAGVKGKFALIAMSERSTVRLLLSAKDSEKATGRETLDKFKIKARKLQLNKPKMTIEAEAMLKAFAPHMAFPLKFIFANMWLFRPLLLDLLPMIKSTKSMVMPTVWLENAADADVLEPVDGCAYSIAYISSTHCNNVEFAIAKFTEIANKHGIAAKVIEQQPTIKPEPIGSVGYALVSDTVRAVFNNVIPAPFYCPGGTDARHFVGIADSVIRFAPIHITKGELNSIHRVDERIHIQSLSGAVKFFRELIKREG